MGNESNTSLTPQDTKVEIDSKGVITQSSSKDSQNLKNWINPRLAIYIINWLVVMILYWWGSFYPTLDGDYNFQLVSILSGIVLIIGLWFGNKYNIYFISKYSIRWITIFIVTLAWAFISVYSLFFIINGCFDFSNPVFKVVTVVDKESTTRRFTTDYTLTISFDENPQKWEKLEVKYPVYNMVVIGKHTLQLTIKQGNLGYPRVESVKTVNN